MLRLLIRRFIPDYANVTDKDVRARYGVLAGVLGMALNLLLFAVKLPIGLIMGSIAITSDAFNNISDMGSSLISAIGSHMAGKRPDRDHPFGHGRIEYVSALAVSFIILLVGFELLKQSIDKFFHPQPVTMNAWLLALMVLSMAVKLWMYRYNKSFGQLIDSQVCRSTAKDSLNDVFTTGAVVLSTVLSQFVSWPVDAVAGLIVSALILYTGYETARDTIDLLLGGRSDPKLVRSIAHRIEACDCVVGVHDLILHDYGPGRVMASAHAEVPADGDILRIHEMIDACEQQIAHELGVPIVIHMDPIVTNDARVGEMREQVRQALIELNPALSFHDFRMTDGKNRINLIFDVVVPIEMTPEARAQLVTDIAAKMRQVDARYRTVVQIDDDYTGV